MSSEFRRRTLLTWSVIGAAGYGLKRASRTPEQREDARAEDRGRPWHGQPINAFAVSPEGRFVATGAAPSGDSLSDATEGVVLWNVDDAAAVWRAPLPGGVMRVDEPFTALVFSFDGSKLAARTRRNELVVIDVATGQASTHYPVSAIEPAPVFFFSQNCTQLFIAASTVPGSIGEVFELDSPPVGKAVRFDSRGALPFRLDDRGVHVIAGSEYRIIGLDGTPATVAAFAAEPHSVVVDVARRHLALMSGAQLVTVDLESGMTLRSEDGAATSVSLSLHGVPLGFDHDVTGWRAYHYSSALQPGVLFTSHDVETERMADASPAALSPDGSHAVELLGTTEVDSWSVRREGKWLGSLGRFPGARGVAFPRDGRVVVFGPRLLAFCDPLARTTLARFGF